MMRRLLQTCLLGVLALGATLSHASIGLSELPGLHDDGPVTVFYPSDSPAANLTRGPFSGWRRRSR